jgi:hypothetical protein
VIDHISILIITPRLVTGIAFYPADWRSQ